MSNKWRVIGGLLVAAILIFGVVAVWATTTPNPTFDTTDIDYSGVTQISIKWERLPIIGAKSGTDAIHVTTSASTMDYAMVGVPTNFTLNINTAISYWGYTVAGGVTAPDEIFLFLDTNANGGVDTVLAATSALGTVGAWKQWTLAGEGNWYTVGGGSTSVSAYYGKQVLGIALAAGSPMSFPSGATSDVYLDNLVVDADGDTIPDYTLDDDTGTIEVLSGTYGTIPWVTEIQDAIDAALPGDTVNVAAGTYNEEVNVDKAVNLVSETGSASNTFLNENISLDSASILLGRLRHGFSIHGNIGVGAGIDASTIHINWNNLYAIMTNNGLNTLDATYNYWGAGSGRVGDIDYRPFLPETVGIIIGYMDDHGMDPLDAIAFSNLLLGGSGVNQALVIMAVCNTFPQLSQDDVEELIDEYGWIAVHNALLLSNGDYEDFVTRLIGYGFAGTNGGILSGGAGGGGASGEGEIEGTYSQGETIHLSFILTDPITGEVTIDPTANLTIVRVDPEPVTVVYWSMIPYDSETGQYSLDIDTSGFAPGIYDLHIGTSSDGHNHQVRIEITAP